MQNHQRCLPAPSARSTTASLFCALLHAVSTCWTSPAAAASFDCAKAATSMEKLVCSDPELSHLDDRLRIAYRWAMKVSGNAEEVKVGQRSWSRELDRKCSKADCIAGLYRKRIDWLYDSGPVAAGACGVDTGQLIGYWRGEGDGPFEEFALAAAGEKHEFTSWLRQRPEYTGSWDLKRCELRIRPEHSEIRYNFLIKGMRFRTLQLIDLESGAQSSFRRAGK